MTQLILELERQNLRLQNPLLENKQRPRHVLQRIQSVENFEDYEVDCNSSDKLGVGV